MRPRPQNVIEYAQKKRKAKGADWIVANDVSPETGIMGGDRNAVHVVSEEGVESWPELDKAEVAAGWSRALPRLADARPRHETRSRRSQIEVKVVRLAHAQGLDLPAYQSPGAAGMDLVAAVPARSRCGSRPARALWCRPG